MEVYLLSKSNHIASPVAIPTLSFDGITRDIFMTMQKEDESLKPLWEYAHNNQKHFFIMDSILMCLTSIQNSISHALVEPQQLRKKFLVAAHEGLGHGGINSTRMLLNKHFTWPKLLDDIRVHIQSCPKCISHNK